MTCLRRTCCLKPEASIPRARQAGFGRFKVDRLRDGRAFWTTRPAAIAPSACFFLQIKVAFAGKRSKGKPSFEGFQINTALRFSIQDRKPAPLAHAQASQCQAEQPE